MCTANQTALLSALCVHSHASLCSCLRSFGDYHLCDCLASFRVVQNSVASCIVKLVRGLMGLVVTLLLNIITLVAGRHPLTTGKVTDATKIAAVCSTGRLECARSDVARRDSAIPTINDFEHDFFVESALVVGGEMILETNLHEGGPKHAFLTDTMTSAASAEAVADFVSSELGSKVHALSTITPATAPAAKSSVTIVNVAKSSLAEGKTIVVCHAVSFPSALDYCHRVTGTKVITATLKPVYGDSYTIKAVGVCHMDTSTWATTHEAFRSLDIRHGDEACHWLDESDMLFYPTANNAAEVA